MSSTFLAVTKLGISLPNPRPKHRKALHLGEDSTYEKGGINKKKSI